MSGLRVACVQLQPRTTHGGDPVAEVRRQFQAVEAVDLVVLPELWNVGFFAFDQYAERAEPLTGRTVTFVQELAAATRTGVVLGSVLERRDDGGLSNTSVAIGPDGVVQGVYRKIHLFGYVSREAELMTAGDQPVVVDLVGTRIGLAICYDLRFPELFRRLVDLGAECLVVPATWPAVRADHWELLLRARAVENLCPVVGCGAAGASEGVALAGASRVVGPWGEPIAVAGSGPETLVAEVDLAETRAVRKEFPALVDRQPWLTVT